MASSAPIGVFDSGVGGISILLELKKLLPNEKFLYLADSAHCPYGVKPIEKIRQRTLEVTDYLISLGSKLVVVACNTACVAGLDQIRAKYPELPVVGVEPAVKPAHEATRNGKIGVLATNLTLSGTKFAILLEKYGTGAEVFLQPAPGLVELVESGEIETFATESLLHQYLDPLLIQGIDTLVLGCTHYPFLRGKIERICGSGITVIDTGAAVARQTARLLDKYQLVTDKTTTQKTNFYTSGDLETVQNVIQKLWFEPVSQVMHFM